MHISMLNFFWILQNGWILQSTMVLRYQHFWTIFHLVRIFDPNVNSEISQVPLASQAQQRTWLPHRWHWGWDCTRCTVQTSSPPPCKFGSGELVCKVHLVQFQLKYTLVQGCLLGCSLSNTYMEFGLVWPLTGRGLTLLVSIQNPDSEKFQ